MLVSELLEQCLYRVKKAEGERSVLCIPLSHQKGNGRFPFLGGGTELLNEKPDGSRVYSVPVHRVLGSISDFLRPLGDLAQVPTAGIEKRREEVRDSEELDDGA